MTRKELREAWQLVPKELEPQMREEYEERAAIMQYDGGLSRADAELRAAELVVGKYLRRGHQEDCLLIVAGMIGLVGRCDCPPGKMGEPSFMGIPGATVDDVWSEP